MMSEAAQTEAGHKFAEHIRELVRTSGLSQRQIAKQSGIRQPALSKFLNGGSMKIETLGSLLELLDYEINPKSSERIEKDSRPASDKENRMTELEGLTGTYSTILIDPPWRFQNRTGKMAPEHRRLHRYETMTTEEIMAMPVGQYADTPSHLYLWCPNALLPEGLAVMKAWGFKYKTNIVWYKTRKDGGPDGRGVGFYFRNVTELLLFGVKGSMRTLAPGRRQVNVISTRKREHSRKPHEAYDVIEACSPGPFLELFARERIDGWTSWGNQVDDYEDTRPLYKAYNGERTDTNALRNGKKAKPPH